MTPEEAADLIDEPITCSGPDYVQAIHVLQRHARATAKRPAEPVETYDDDGALYEAGPFEVAAQPPGANPGVVSVDGRNVTPHTARQLARVLTVAADRAAGGRTAEANYDERFWLAFKDAEVIHDGDDQFRAPTMFERQRMTEVANEALAERPADTFGDDQDYAAARAAELRQQADELDAEDSGQHIMEWYDAAGDIAERLRHRADQLDPHT